MPMAVKTAIALSWSWSIHLPFDAVNSRQLSGLFHTIFWPSSGAASARGLSGLRYLLVTALTRRSSSDFVPSGQRCFSSFEVKPRIRRWHRRRHRVILGRKTFHLAVAFRAALIFSIARKWRFWPPTIGGVGHGICVQI